MKEQILNRLTMVSNWFGYKTNSPDAYVVGGALTAWGMGKRMMSISLIFIVLCDIFLSNGFLGGVVKWM